MKLVLAPLAGFTDAPFRSLCRAGGAAACCTEMVSAAGLFHGSEPTRCLMETLPVEGPVVCQLFGAREDELAFAAREASRGPFAALDLNAGCPMAKVTRAGAGAKLVEDPEKIHSLLRAMVAESRLPVTLKTRLGPHPRKTLAFEILDAAECAGAAGVTFHARYTSQLHAGHVHLDLLAELVSRARVPVGGNGGVTDAAGLAAMAATGVSSVMIGRAALARPGVFAALAGRTSDLDALSPAALARRHVAALLAFRRQLAERRPGARLPSEDAYVAMKARTHLFRYFSGRPGACALRARFNAVRTRAEVEAILEDEP